MHKILGMNTFDTKNLPAFPTKAALLTVKKKHKKLIIFNENVLF